MYKYLIMNRFNNEIVFIDKKYFYQLSADILVCNYCILKHDICNKYLPTLICDNGYLFNG